MRFVRRFQLTQVAQGQHPVRSGSSEDHKVVQPLPGSGGGVDLSGRCRGFGRYDLGGVAEPELSQHSRRFRCRLGGSQRGGPGGVDPG